MNKELHDLANSGTGPTALRAQYALQLNAAFQTGQVSVDEYKALLEDLANTGAMAAEADSLESKQMLVFGITQLIQIAG